MGGPFSAQSADVRSIWGAKRRVDLMRTLGNLQFSPRGHPLWHTPCGNILSLAHFRDNVLVGARGRSASAEMQRVCDTLFQVWELPVLCDCMSLENWVCNGACMGPSLTTMGFTTHLVPDCPQLIYAQPSGLTKDWHLKYSATLQTPNATTHKRVSNIIVGAVLSVEPFLHTWISCLLSITTWAQIACFFGYSRSAVSREVHSAVPRRISRAPWDVDSTLHWCRHVTYILPATRDTIFFRLHRWVQSTADWCHGAYASWHMPRPGPRADIRTDSCFHFPVIQSLTPLRNPASSICLGRQPRGEGGVSVSIYHRTQYMT